MARGARGELLFGCAVAAVALIVYANSLGNGFVWDDDVVIVGNPALKGPAMALFSGIDTGRSSELTPYYRPLTLLTFLVEARLHDLTPVLVRLFNVLLHAANAFLVFRLARSFFTDPAPALVAALLFAVHPLHSEGVDFNAGGRNTMLSCLFVLSAYLLHRRGRDGRSLLSAGAGAVLFLAGLLSKETTLALLPFIVALEIAPLRSPLPGARSGALFRLIPYGAATLLYGLLRGAALAGAGVRLDILPGLGTRLLQNLYGIPRYLLTVAWPPAQSAKYFVPDDLHLLALPLAGAWLAIAAGSWWLLTGGRSRVTLFGTGWLVAFWLPVSGIIPIPSAPLADRYLYIPAIGLWLIVADQAGRVLSGRAALRRYAAGGAAVLLLVLAGLTVRRNLDWHDDISLFTRLTAQYPERAFGHHNLGCAWLDKKKNLDQAALAFEKALSLDPLFPRLRTQMGYVCLQRGDLEGALRHYTEAVLINPGDAEAHLNRGIVLEAAGRYGEALDEYRHFLAVPGNDLPGARPLAEAKVRGLAGQLSGTVPK